MKSPAKRKQFEEQHGDLERHIAVLKELKEEYKIPRLETPPKKSTLSLPFVKSTVTPDKTQTEARRIIQAWEEPKELQPVLTVKQVLPSIKSPQPPNSMPKLVSLVKIHVPKLNTPSHVERFEDDDDDDDDAYITPIKQLSPKTKARQAVADMP